MRKQFCVLVVSALVSLPAFAGSDVAFIEKASSGGMLEVKLGEHAVKNAASADVRKFGQRMVDDHTAANRELEALARKEGVAIPNEMSAHDTKMAKELMAQAGAAFDKSYMKMMVSDHADVVTAFQAEAKDGKTDVDRWAAQTVPTLEAHLAEAREIDKRVNGTMSNEGR